MHHEISLLANLAIALVVAFVGGLLARQIGLPTIVGYLLAGMAIGPFTPGFVGDVEDIRQLAEIGVIFLMFGVGLHFSLKDLWDVRQVALPGAMLQMAIATGLGFALSQLWGWAPLSGLMLGLSISIASTVVLLRGLMDNGLLSTTAGRIAVGWLVMEDLATVLILVMLPILFGGHNEQSLWSAILSLLKVALFVTVVLFIGRRLLPKLLDVIVATRSRELFILAAVAIALGTAFGAAAFFDVSLALGAFLAGVVLNETQFSHQIGDDVLPFRETFAVIFFVSVGMIVNPVYLWANAGQVLALTALIVLGKSFFTQLLGFVLPASGRTMLIVAAGLSQIGEFSFILGQAGVTLGLLTTEQYSLILAGSLLSIMVNPLMFRSIKTVERVMQRMSPRLWERFDQHPLQPADLELPREGHVVVVGYGRVGQHIVNVLERLGVPRLVIEIDSGRAAEFNARGIPTLFGDAANSDVLIHAGLERARALVVTLPDETATEMVVAAARKIAPNLPIIARAATTKGVGRLLHLGAHDVIHPELEGGLEVMRHTLLCLGYPATQVQGYTDAVRRDEYDTTVSSDAEHQALDQMVRAARGIEIAWRLVSEQSPIVGQTLAEANIRARTGASVIALIRNQQLIANPKSSTVFQAGDLLGLIGDREQIAAAEQLLSGTPAAELVPATS
ncbi:cation:proton antiporter [Chloroflexus sp. MS-CIW-1]|uniref:cation:proton antiporter domain-containing protein n=1 Tax=Chloroflexus sp. MS-CIW-1 TaxID=3055768 RepID=UPI002647B216|nr:cation:proton antiporter [Chloroflexus sp. MS-CIW-1]MDN5272088.1 cation:proton antiporter [Chloroflexus sp. MS-CIW-1]